MRKWIGILIIVIIVLLVCTSCKQRYDVIIRHGNVYDGTGANAFIADVAISGDTIAAIGDLSECTGSKEIEARGLAVSPGFINMLSWATESLMIDGSSQSDIRQGITLEVMGEGTSMGPLNATMKAAMKQDNERAGMSFPISWTTLAEYLTMLEKKGIATNVASFVGATTIRVHEIGLDDRAPTTEELERMKSLVDQAMKDGALGIGSSLIYAPASYAKTEELIALCKVAAKYNGMYITHMRSEGNDILQAVDETIRIAEEAKLPAEIYHLKIAGSENWNKLDDVIAKIAGANRRGIRITADMYSYAAGATGLDAAMPPWLQAGGTNEWIRRMKDPETRNRALREMRQPNAGWENLMRLAGGPGRMLLVDFSNDSLKRFTGKTLEEVSKIYGKPPEETAMDLVCADSTRIGTVYFMMSEENIRKQFALPYISLGSDAASISPDSFFIKSNVHPRAYGNVARFLAKYVRDEKVITLAEGIRRLTFLPASNLRLNKRGRLAVGYFADIVVFDPEKIQDHATFEKPHQLSTGVSGVWVNGVAVLADSELTGKRSGRVIRRSQVQ